MILVKCKCGCLFTITDEKFITMSNLICNNCSSSVKYDQNKTLRAFSSELEQSDLQVYRLPDDVKINFNFN